MVECLLSNRIEDRRTLDNGPQDQLWKQMGEALSRVMSPAVEES